MVAAADSVRLGVARFRGTNRPDVILGSVPGLPTLPAALAVGRALRRPVVVELRDAWPDLLLSAGQWSEPAACPSAVAQARRVRGMNVVSRGARSLLTSNRLWMPQVAMAAVLIVYLKMPSIIGAPNPFPTLRRAR